MVWPQHLGRIWKAGNSNTSILVNGNGGNKWCYMVVPWHSTKSVELPFKLTIFTVSILCIIVVFSYIKQHFYSHLSLSPPMSILISPLLCLFSSLHSYVYSHIVISQVLHPLSSCCITSTLYWWHCFNIGRNVCNILVKGCYKQKFNQEK